jgi:hypothetical protein
MPSILDGLALVDTTGHLILATIVMTMLFGVVANLFLRARYAAMEEDLERSPHLRRSFSHAVLTRIVREATQARAASREQSVQALIENAAQFELRPLLLVERFVRAATGLVIILGLLGTFYGLALSIGKLVHLVAGDAGAATDIAQSLTTGLTQALSGMAVAFSNSLLGIASAIVLPVLGIFSNVTDRRVGFMIQVEAYLERALAEEETPAPAVLGADPRVEQLERVVQGFGEAVGRLEGAVTRFDCALEAFAASTRDFKEFNLHLKDNVQRMSLSFGDFSETMKSEIRSLKSSNGG